MINLVVNGVTYSYPQTGDQNWGDGATNWASAVTSGMLSKAGGTFTLTAGVNFGSSFGLTALSFTSVSSNPASTGVIALANTDSISWRNSGNTADIALQPDADGILQYGGIDLVNLSATQSLSNKTLVSPIFSGGVTLASTLTLTFSGEALAFVPATATSGGYMQFSNTGGIGTIGQEGATASINTGGTAYALALSPAVGKVLELGYSGGTAVALRIDASGNTNILGNAVITGTAGASNLSGTNTGNVTIGTANGLSLSGQALSLAAASTSTTGALTSTDWNTFNGKQSAITEGNLTEATSSVLTISGGTNAVIGSGTSIQVKQSSGSVSGYLSSTDWTTFNNKAPTASPTFTGTVAAAAVTLSGLFTSTANGEAILISPTTGTHNAFIQLTNTGGSSFFGIESSAGGGINTGGTAYALAIAPPVNHVLEIGYSGGAGIALRVGVDGAGTNQVQSLGQFIGAGTATNDSAASGYIGEYGKGTTAVGTNVPGTTGQYYDASSISLTAGDWDVSGIIEYGAGTAAAVTYIAIGISTTTGNSSTGLTEGDNFVFGSPSNIAVQNVSIVMPSVRMSLASTTTVYLKGRSAYTGGTPTYGGRISARRVR